MTIAIGFVCSDGIVIGADSEEIVGYGKRRVEKVRYLSVASSTFVFAGAGTSDLIDSTIDAICRDLKTKRPRVQDIQSVIGDHVKRAFDQNILPFASLAEEDRPHLTLLVGVQTAGKCQLFKVCTPRKIIEIRNHDAIGIGLNVAVGLMDKFRDHPVPCRQTANLAVHILRCTKDTVLDCDGFSDIVMQKENGHSFWLPHDYVNQVERSFKFLKQAEYNFVRALIGLDDDPRKLIQKSATELERGLEIMPEGTDLPIKD